MKKLLKRITTWLLVAIMMITCVPLDAFAQTVDSQPAEIAETQPAEIETIRVDEEQPAEVQQTQPAEEEAQPTEEEAQPTEAEETQIEEPTEEERALAEAEKEKLVPPPADEAAAEKPAMPAIEGDVVTLPALAGVGDNPFSEVESNNNFALADTIYDDYTVSGSCNYYDYDYFKIDISTQSNILIIFTGEHSSWKLRLYDGSQELITSLYTSYDYTNQGYFAQIERELSAGTYYIEVENYKNSSYSYNNAYVFWVDVEPLHNHVYTAEVIAPTCTQQGYTYYRCECGYYYSDHYTPMLPHSSDKWIVEQEATCTTTGIRHKVCDNCGTAFGTESYINAHKDAWTLTKAPTTIESGTLTKCCSVCGGSFGSVSVNIGLNIRDDVTVYITEQGALLYNRWKEVSGKWYYFGADGAAKRNAWQDGSGGPCYLTGDGSMATNQWVDYKGVRYYVNAYGYRVKDMWVDGPNGKCYLTPEGYMATNRWVCYKNVWYYVGSNGARLTDIWMDGANGKCYLTPEGYMATNRWVNYKNVWYYVGANGARLTDVWMGGANGKCYLTPEGYMATNRWVCYKNVWYYVGANGARLTDIWMDGANGKCYLTPEGYMATNRWVNYKNVWYYVGANGARLTDVWMDGANGKCYLTPEGYMATNRWVCYKDVWYYVGANGARLTDIWMDGANGKCYLTPEGYMAVNRWICYKGTWYYVGENGARLTDIWVDGANGKCYLTPEGYMAVNRFVYYDDEYYYVGSDGARVTGWMSLNGSTYYFGSGGSMWRDCLGEIGDRLYKFKSDGRMAVNEAYRDGYIGADGVIPASCFLWHAQFDVRMEKADYPNAQARYGFIHAYIENSELCVISYIYYRIGSYDYSIESYHNLTTGAYIVNPSEHYQDLADRYSGATRLKYLQLKQAYLREVILCLSQGSYLSYNQLNP